jgi:molecular chaperone DnaK
VVTTNVNLPFITADQDGPKHLDVTITRAKFDDLTKDLVERTTRSVNQALADAKLQANDIDEVILVGGSTRIPAVQDLVKRLTGKDPNKSVNPDEVVAVGAAIQSGVLAGEVKDVVLLDVTPLSLGIETLGGVMTKLIERNTTIPSRKSETFSTAADGQSDVHVKVFQGEREIAAHNKLLGDFQLSGIPPAPRGIPQIEVTFDIDANGILSVRAQDKASGKEQSITVTGSSNLNKNDVERMVAEAAAHAEEDRKIRERAELRNRADQMIYQTERTLKDLGDKVTAQERTDIEARIAAVRSALEADDAARVETELQALQTAGYGLSERLYKEASAQQPGAGDAAGGGGNGYHPGADASDARSQDGDVIDAEFKSEESR